MAYNEALASRIRQRLADIPKVQEVRMMGGLTLMCNGKMCVGVCDQPLYAAANSLANSANFLFPRRAGLWVI
jgi:TfoX/Sxy family transcriptional regulator of competence genes